MYKESYVKALDLVAKNIKEYNGKGIGGYASDTKLLELGLDSLETVNLIMGIEHDLGKEVPGPKKVPLTIGDLVRYIEQYV